MSFLKAINGNKKEIYELQLIYIFYSVRNLCSVTIKQTEAMWIGVDCLEWQFHTPWKWGNSKQFRSFLAISCMAKHFKCRTDCYKYGWLSYSPRQWKPSGQRISICKSIFSLYNMRTKLLAVNQISDAGYVLKYTNVPSKKICIGDNWNPQWRPARKQYR